MKIDVIREACCSADDQLGPLEAEFVIDADGSFGELVEQIRASRFLQFSSTHNRISGEVDGKCLVEVHASGGLPPTFHVEATLPVSRVIGAQKLFFYFRHT